MKRLKFDAIYDYASQTDFPIYTEYRADRTYCRITFDNLPNAERQRLVKQETRLLHEIEKRLTTGLNHQEAEAKVYPESPEFYQEFDWARRKWLESQENPSEKKEKLKRGEKSIEKGEVFLERDLSKRQRESLYSKGFRRMKISPYGDSGAAYYWIQKRFNESQEHAFFCYLIEKEVKNREGTPKLNVTDGPDIEFEHGGKKYAFEVETGSVLKRNPDYVQKKFEKLKEKYNRIFVFVTSFKLKYRYSKFAKVISRSTLRKTLNRIFHKRQSYP
ncbi:hypothetical protein HYV43_00475 [Candidatus Micrarchaeota archaeon]|nr:hypothetical protein [Candidatus Micrarchaeota archaeon]